MTFNEWMGTLGFDALVHANCCRKAYEAGQQSQQAKVDEYILVAETLDELYVKEVEKNKKLQKRVDAAERQLQLVQQCIEESSYTKWPSSVRLIQVSDLEQALKGEV